ncbi:efflux RND transporter permease subunit, partial [Paramuribaculum intestinale]|uniref:efflux RND transporter permease subunit n=1 Tax=Paramuribaculum intestinale TaxID=2094151 RepID=UPI0025A56D3F
MKLDTFINRPVLSTVISIFIVLLGLIGLFSLPVTQFPDIAPPTIRVSTTYQGANAQAVLNSVIAPLEESINGAQGMTHMESTATNSGSADITVYFEQGFNPDMAAVDVQNRVSKALNLLPAEVTQVGVQTAKRQSSMLLMVSLYDASGNYSMEFIDNYAKINIIPQLQRVSGVGDVMSFGADYSMRIWLKPEVMAQYGLMPTDITYALSEQNIEAAPGTFGEQGDQSFQYTMKYKGRLTTPEQFEDIVVAAKPTGEILRLGDVAEVELGRLTYGFSNSLNGKVATSCIVFQTAGSNATQIINDCLAVIKDGRVVMFAPPMISGYSLTNGFEIKMQDKTGGSVEDFFAVVQGFLAQLNQQPEVQVAMTTFNPTFPQYLVDIDAAKAKQAGLSPRDILTTLQGYYGGMYVSNFNRFGKIYRVMMQASPEARVSPETLASIKVRNGGEMASLSNFVTMQKVYGPDLLNRFNMFQSISVNGNPAPGYTSGDCLAAITRVAQETLPPGYGYEYSGMTREEASSGAGSTTAVIFGLCLLFVYLLLSAQYESYILPMSVILSIPFGLMGTFIFAQIFGVSNNIYLQIALIMLIGLLAKNAILIV